MTVSGTLASATPCPPQCVAGCLDECLLPGVDVHPERARAVQTRAFVAGVVLGDDRGEGLGPVGNDSIR